jgi:acetyl esterase/lipase
MHDDTIRDQIRRTLGDEATPTLERLAARVELPPGFTITRHWFAGIPSEWINPPEPRLRVILYLHGGGVSMGSCAAYRGFVGRLARACRARAVVPEYRIAPEHPFPAGLDDTVEVYATLLGHGITPEQLVLIGDSAGGGLCLSTLIEARRRGLPMPRAMVLLSPWTDLTLSGASITSRAEVDPWLQAERLEPICADYLAGTDPADPRVSPLWADLTGLPPTLIQVGDDEILLDDSLRLAARARAAGVEVDLEIGEGLWHLWHLSTPTLPEANAAIDRIGRFISPRFIRHSLADATAADNPVVQRAREVTRRQAFRAVTEKFSTST